MRRRPSGVSPSSWGGASVISARSSGWRFKRFQHPEELAVGARRAAFLLLAARVADEGAQPLQVGAGVPRDVGGGRPRIGPQLFPPSFHAPLAGGLLRRIAGERGELR